MTGRDLAALRERLSTRDLAILADLERFRLLSSRQIQRLHFAHDHRSPVAAARACNRALARLRDLGLLRALIRRVGGVRSGSAGYVWHLGPVGERLQRIAGDRSRTRRRYSEPSRHFVEHTLAIAEVAVTALEADHGGSLEVLQVATEPRSWQSSLSRDGVAVWLKPDLQLITASGEFEHHWFLEIDRDSEHLPVIVRQSQAYQRYRASGRYQAAHGLFPAVLWVVPSEKRAAAIRAAISSAADLDDQLFDVCTFDQIGGVLLGWSDHGERGG